MKNSERMTRRSFLSPREIHKLGAAVTSSIIGFGSSLVNAPTREDVFVNQNIKGASRDSAELSGIVVGGFSVVVASGIAAQEKSKKMTRGKFIKRQAEIYGKAFGIPVFSGAITPLLIRGVAETDVHIVQPYRTGKSSVEILDEIKQESEKQKANAAD